MDIRIDNESFAAAYNCLAAANKMLDEGLGDYSELNSDALKLVKLQDLENATKLSFLKTNGNDIQDRMRTTIEYLSSMDAESRKLFNEKITGEEFGTLVTTLNKVGDTLAEGTLLFTEGLLTGCENIVDGVICIGGAIAGIFSKDAKAKMLDFAGIDFVGKLYEGAYDNFEDSIIGDTGAAVIKAFGTATTYVALAAATGGGSIAANTVVAGVGAFGAGTQEALNSGLDYDESLAYGAKEGAKSAALTFGFSKGAEYVVKGAGTVVSKLSSGGAKAAAGAGDDVLGAAAKAAAGTSDDFAAAAAKTAAGAGDDVLGTAAKAAAGAADDAVAAGAKATSAATNYADMAELNAAREAGKISKTEFRELAKQLHPDMIEGAAARAANSVDDISNAVGNAAGSADDMLNVAEKALTVSEPSSLVVPNAIANSVDDVAGALVEMPTSMANVAGNVANAASTAAKTGAGLAGTIGSYAANVPLETSRNLRTAAAVPSTPVVDDTTSSTGNSTTVVPPITNVPSDTSGGGNSSSSGTGTTGTSGGGNNGGSGGGGNSSSTSTIENKSNETVTTPSGVSNLGSSASNNTSSSSSSGDIYKSIVNSPYSNLVVDSPNAVVDSYNNSVIDSYNVTDSYNTTNNYYSSNECAVKSTESGQDDTLKTILGLGVAGLTGAATAVGYTAMKDKKDKKNNNDDFNL